MRFDEAFPESTTVVLDQNYRSTQRILDAANSVIANNPSHRPKHLWTDKGEGEPIGIWNLLGSARLALPVAEYRPDLVVHGHAHAGRFEGAIGDTPVYNVAVQVIGRDFYVFELEATAGRSEVEVDAPSA